MRLQETDQSNEDVNFDSICLDCETTFQSTINLNKKKDLQQFKNTLFYLKIFDEKFGYPEKKLPLIYPIKINYLENMYLEWIQNNKLKGNHLLIWPYQHVNFLPLLINNYCTVNTSKKIFVLYFNSANDSNINKEIDAQFDLFDNLYYIEEDNIVNINEKLKKERNKFKEKQLVKKIKKNIITIRIHGSKASNTNVCKLSLTKCQRKIINELREMEISEDDIKELKVKQNQKEKVIIKNENGKVSILIEAQKGYPCDNIKIKKNTIWKFLNNITKVEKSFYRSYEKNNKLQLLSEKFNCKHIVLKDKNKNIVTILYCNNKLLNPETAEEFFSQLLGESRIDLLIIPEYDYIVEKEFINNSRFIGKKIGNLGESQLVLLFSINPEKRSYYSFFNENSIYRNKFIVHPIDNEYILSQLYKGLGKIMQKTTSSNTFYSDEIDFYKLKLLKEDYVDKIKFVEIKGYKPIDAFLFKLIQLNELDEVQKQLLRKFLLNFQKTLLDLKTTKKTEKPFTIWFNGERLSYEVITIKYFYERYFDEFVKNLSNTISPYLDQGYNPLRDAIIKEINKLTQETSNYKIYLVINYRDNLKTIERKFKEKISYPDFHIVTWNKLVYDFSFSRQENVKNVIIAYDYPPMMLNLNRILTNSDLIFVGSKYWLERIKKAVKYRLNKVITYPMILTSQEFRSYLPTKLLNILPENNEEVEEINKEIYIDYNFTGHSPNLYVSETKRYRLPPKTKAYVFHLENGWIIFPEKSEIYTYDEKTEEFKIVRLSKGSLLKGLLHKFIIIEKNGFYNSLKLILFKFMIENSSEINVLTPIKNWSCFLDLYNDAILWNNVLEKTVDLIRKKENYELYEAEDALSKKIAQLGITAKNTEYIKSWWRDYEIIDTNLGPFKIYNIERPKRRSDLEKIFEMIEKEYPDLGIMKMDAIISYSAAKTLQMLRTTLLKKHHKGWISRALSRKFKKVIEEKIEQSRRSRIKKINKIETLATIEAYKLQTINFDSLVKEKKIRYLNT